MSFLILWVERIHGDYGKNHYVTSDNLSLLGPLWITIKRHSRKDCLPSQMILDILHDSTANVKDFSTKVPI